MFSIKKLLQCFTSISTDAQLTLKPVVTATTLSVTWNNYNAYLYNLTISEGSSPASRIITLPPTATGYTFTNLKPFTTYTVSVTPIALDGTKEAPVTETLKTKTAGMSKFY